MANVQIRNVPDDVHRELLRRADRAGQSLQQYLTEQLVQLVATPTIDDVLARIDRRSKGRCTASDSIDALDQDRAGR